MLCAVQELRKFVYQWDKSGEISKLLWNLSASRSSAEQHPTENDTFSKFQSLPLIWTCKDYGKVRSRPTGMKCYYLRCDAEVAAGCLESRWEPCPWALHDTSFLTKVHDVLERNLFRVDSNIVLSTTGMYKCSPGTSTCVSEEKNEWNAVTLIISCRKPSEEGDCGVKCCDCNKSLFWYWLSCSFLALSYVGLTTGQKVRSLKTGHSTVCTSSYF